MKKVLNLLTGTLIIALLFSCKKEDAVPTAKNINPADANALQSAIIIQGATLVPGNLPAPSGSGAPVTSLYQNSASISPGGNLILPFRFTSGSGYSTCYVQIQGATNGYWRIPNPNAGSSPNSGTIGIPIRLPSNLDLGSFCVVYCIVDNSGRVSNIMITCVSVEESLNCSNASKAGNEGLTFTTVTMGNTSGNAVLQYDTYSVPDRIDVYQGSTWLMGTGNNPNSIIPPISNCSAPANGFVGRAGTFNIPYNPSAGKELTIVVSGCLGGGTAWDWQLSCP